MGFYTGRSGALFLNSSLDPLETEQVLKIRDWSLDTSLELLETTSIDTAVKSYTPGMVSATGSATVMYYRKEPSEKGVQFEQLLNKIMKTTTAGVTTADRVIMTLRVGSQSAGETATDILDDIRFYAYITSAGMKVGTGELSSVSIQFTVDGPFLEIVES